jgi:hypothetical protein
MKHYFTFGQAHSHTYHGVIYDKDCVVEIEAASAMEARNKMFKIFGSVWAFQYDSLPDMGYYPRGIIKLR